MKIDNLMCQLECSFMHDFEGAWVHLQSVRSVHFREDCNAYELLLNLYAIYQVGITRNSAASLCHGFS